MTVHAGGPHAASLLAIFRGAGEEVVSVRMANMRLSRSPSFSHQFNMMSALVLVGVRYSWFRDTLRGGTMEPLGRGGHHMVSLSGVEVVS